MYEYQLTLANLRKVNEGRTASKRKCIGPAPAPATPIAIVSDITIFTDLFAESATKLWSEETCLWVSKIALMKIPSFREMFSKEWEQSEHHLYRDDLDALKVMMAILHHRPSVLPVSMSTMQLSNLATVCEKYSVADIISPHVESSRWIDNLWKDGEPCDGIWEAWLWILDVFPTKTTEKYPRREKVLDMFAANAILHEGFWTLKRGEYYCDISQIRSLPKLAPLDGRI
jgi:hypothetical protein